MSIKLRITLWIALFMTALSVIMLAFIGLTSSAASDSESRREIVELTDDNSHEVEYDDGVLEIDDDFVFFRSGMYCMVFDENGTLLGGSAPYSQLEAEPFETDGRLRTVTVGEEAFLVYDRCVSEAPYPDIWLRGVVSADTAAISRSALYRAAFIAFPLLILLAVAGGYIVARRSLRPIRDINATAEAIGSSGDLSKRIELKGGRGDELHKLAGTFNHMFERLEQNFEAERSFTSDASHELRTPVATILAQCEYAFENASGEDELYEALGVIQKQGYRMNRLISSLLQFTRMEQHTEKIEMLPLDMSELVRTVCQEQRELAVKNIALREAIEDNIRLRGNATLLIRLLENLIRNSYRYGVENGLTEVSLKREGDNIILSVADNGIGIEAEELPKIWTRFYRVDKARNTSEKSGLGLGLAMVKQIAEFHGGSVRVESAVGRGSRFSVRF